MVYIQPIQSDTYTQYVNRSIPVKTDYALLTAASAIHLNKRYFEEERRHSDHRRFAKILEAKKRQLNRKHQDPLHSEIGMFFDECI